MREIKYIVLHCTATNQKATVEGITKYWKEVQGWKDPGYHFLIRPDGSYVNLQPIEKPSNGVKGYNQHSIHISYIGGIDAKGAPTDNRTDAQKDTMYLLARQMKTLFPKAEFKGHRDFLTPGKPGWKACPSFEVKDWIKEVGL